jgi:hypothetical protein
VLNKPEHLRYVFFLSQVEVNVLLLLVVGEFWVVSLSSDRILGHLVLDLHLDDEARVAVFLAC